MATDYTKVNNITKQLLGAMEIMADSKVNGLEYDKTVKASIVAISDLTLNKYIVQEETASYEAYADNGIEYAVGNQVFITIPQNNYSNRKIIIGLAYGKDYERQKAVSYDSHYLQATNNLYNGTNKRQYSDNSWIHNSPNISNFTALNVNARFQTKLPDDVSFGLRIIVTTVSSVVGTNSTANTFIYTFTNNEMFGDTNNFSVPQRQYKTFDISGLDNIKKIELVMFLDGQDGLGTDEYYNIYDTNISFGYYVSEIEDENLILSSSSGRYYSSSDLNKVLCAKWIRKNESGEAEVAEIDMASFKLYRYTGTASSDTDPLLGNYWHEISAGSNPELISVQCNNSNLRENYKAIIIKNGNLLDNIYSKDVLTFYKEATGTTSGGEQLTPTQDLVLTFNDGSKGKYSLYGPNGQIISQTDSSKSRTITASMLNGYGVNINSSVDSGFNGGESFTWSVSGDMIQQVGTSSSNTFTYTISPYYKTGKNSVKCEVTKDGIKYEKEIELNFGLQGNDGMDYRFVYFCSKDGIAPGESAIYTCKILDSNWKEVTAVFSGELVNTDDTYVFDSQAFSVTRSDSSVVKPYAYLKVTATFNSLTIIEYIPIISKDTAVKYKNFSGPCKIIYDSLGSNPQYNKIPYSLDLNGTTTSASWSIVYESASYNENDIPKITNNTLHPSSSYKNMNSICYCYVKGGTDGNGYYYCPIVITQNKKSFSILNEWDGKTYIGTNDIIMSSMIVAGKKESDKTFTGVVIGDVQHLSDSTTSVKSGVYGFQHGEKTFSITEDGDAYFKGGIESSSLISSTLTGDDYEAPTTETSPYSTNGMKIDLNQDTIIAKNFAIDDTGAAHFKGSIEASTLTGNNYEAPTTETSPYSANGMKIDLTENTIISPNFVISNGSANLQGNVVATSGNIGGWGIHEYTRSGNTYKFLGSEIEVEEDGTTVKYGIGLNANDANNTSYRVMALGRMPDGISGSWANTNFWIDGKGRMSAEAYNTWQNVSYTADTQQGFLDLVKQWTIDWMTANNYNDTYGGGYMRPFRATWTNHSYYAGMLVYSNIANGGIGNCSALLTLVANAFNQYISYSYHGNSNTWTVIASNIS